MTKWYEQGAPLNEWRGLTRGEWISRIVTFILIAVFFGVAYGDYHEKGHGWLIVTAVLMGALFAAAGYVFWDMGIRRHRCPQCAEKVREDAKVCRYCGADLTTTVV